MDQMNEMKQYRTQSKQSQIYFSDMQASSSLQNQSQIQSEFSIKDSSSHSYYSSCLYCLLSTLAILVLILLLATPILALQSHTINYSQGLHSNGNKSEQLVTNTDETKVESDKNVNEYRVKQEQNIKKQQEMRSNISETFTNTTFNTFYFPNLYSYISHNRAKSVLEIYPNDKYKQKLIKVSNTKKLKFTNADTDSDIDTFLQNSVKQTMDDKIIWGDQFDWVEVCDVLKFWSNFINNQKDIGLLAKFGVSIRVQQGIDMNNLQLQQKIKEYFSKLNMVYEEPKSLSLSQAQNQTIFIFIKYRQSSFNPPFASASKLAIHTVMRLTQNIPYLREWLGYHSQLGVTKFFIYDNTNSQKSDLSLYDQKVTYSTNKNGLNLECIQSDHLKAFELFRSIWDDYYWSIVYIRWEPKDQMQRVIYAQSLALQDYILHFKNMATFTAFIDPDEFIYSRSNFQIIQYLNNKLNLGVTSIKLRSFHFQSRFCSPYSRVTDITFYMPAYERQAKPIWSAKIIAATEYFKPYGVHDGSGEIGYQEIVSSEEIRINHYNFDYWGLKEARENKFAGAREFEEDNSLSEKYREVIETVCLKGCSEKFALKCPIGKQYKYCLNPYSDYPKNLDLDRLKKELEGTHL